MNNKHVVSVQRSTTNVIINAVGTRYRTQKHKWRQAGTANRSTTKRRRRGRRVMANNSCCYRSWRNVQHIITVQIVAGKGVGQAGSGVGGVWGRWVWCVWAGNGRGWHQQKKKVYKNKWRTGQV